MLSLLDIRARISAGTLTPAGAIDLCRAAIAAREPDLHALVTLDPAPAIPETGPLAGIAVGVKDIIDSAGLPSQMGSPIYAGWMPRGDAAVVSRLKQLGAMIQQLTYAEMREFERLVKAAQPEDATDADLPDALVEAAKIMNPENK